MKTKKQVSGKTMTKKTKAMVNKSKPVEYKLTTEELEDALFEAEQDFQKAVLKIMLLGETLRSIKEDNEIKGKKIELGILERKLTKEVRGWFNEFGYELTSKSLKKVFKNVPIEVRIIKRSYPFFKHLDSVFYKTFDAIDIPNPWRACYKIRGLIR